MTHRLTLNQHNWEKAQSAKGQAWVAGHAFHGSDYCSSKSLAALILNELEADTPFLSFIQRINGHYAIIAEYKGQLFFSTDIIRSIPLYYRVGESEIHISDEFETLRQPSDSFNADSIVDIATAGFVTGTKTVLSEISALQSSEYGIWESDTLSLERHYEYRCTYASEESEESLCQQLDDATLNSFKRALKVCDGRQIALPLSGGLDSRHIASMLKRLGYENVFCFAYGLEGNYESGKSKEVADALGFPWMHVAYDEETLSHTLFSDEASRYQTLSHGGVSVPFIDDWGALYLLKRDGIIDDNAVFMPGQSGDFTCGSHLKYLFDPIWHDDPQDVFGAIIKKHFSCWEDILADDSIQAKIIEHLTQESEAFDLSTDEGRASLYEYWECHERQVKYVINGGRGYEFFGHQWTYPLWDKELMDFWKPISIPFKMDSYLYRKYLATYDPYNLFQDDERKDLWTREWAFTKIKKQSQSKRIEKSLMNIPLLGSIIRLRHLHRKHKHYLKRNPLGYPRGYGYYRYTWKELGKRHHLSLLLKDFMLNKYGLDIHKYLLP